MSAPLSQLFTIFYQICLPILLLCGVGYALQRGIGLDIHALKTLTFYVILPVVIFSSVVTSRVPPGDVLRVLLFAATFLLSAGVLINIALRFRGMDGARRRAIVLLSVNPNAGNFGFPVQELVFQPIGRGAEAQILLSFVIIAQNVVNFTVGVIFLAGGDRRKGVREHLRTILTFPPLYALLIAVVVRRLDLWVQTEDIAWIDAVVAPVWRAMGLIRGAFVPVALLTLGAQLGTMRLRTGDVGVLVAVILRMIAGPAFAFMLILVFGIEGFIAQVLFLAFGGPSAVNAMLLCLEFDASPELAARTVLYTTLVSPVTVTVLIYLATSGFFERFVV